MKMKRPLLVGATLATLTMAGVGGLGMASAATSTSSSGGTSIVDKIAAKFNLNKSDVQAVFDADRQEHEAQMKADQKERLAQAVKDGKITQDQSDYITKALDEIDALRGDSDPRAESDTVRDQIKTKLDALRDWAKQNNVDMQYIGPMGHGPGGHGDLRASASSSSTSSTGN